MKFKDTVRKSAVIIAIVLLALLCGYLYQVIGHSSDLGSHPREYTEYVGRYAAEYGVPEQVIYATVLNVSDFRSNFVSDSGRIGLMQIHPETFRVFTTMNKESFDSGMLYDPDTNLRYGAYMMSYYFTKYNRWKTVVAIMLTDEETVTRWMDDSSNTDEQGNLVTIPDKSVSRAVENIENDMEMYQKLYYSE